MSSGPFALSGSTVIFAFLTLLFVTQLSQNCILLLCLPLFSSSASEWNRQRERQKEREKKTKRDMFGIFAVSTRGPRSVVSLSISLSQVLGLMSKEKHPLTPPQPR